MRWHRNHGHVDCNSNVSHSQLNLLSLLFSLFAADSCSDFRKINGHIMPYLTPEALSPASKAVRTTDVESKGRAGICLFEDSILEPDTANVGGNGGDISEEEVSNAYPVVRLDVERITDTIAGRLATTLLGHVLFLKNQVPL
jgi:hypothetical protein